MAASARANRPLRGWEACSAISAAAGPGGLLSGGLKELVDRFNANGESEAVNSWVGTGPNKELPSDKLKSAIGPDVLAALSEQTGLPQDELLARLSRSLPDAVDKYTPDGQLPGDTSQGNRS